MSDALRRWLETVGLAHDGDRFAADDIDLDLLPSLSEQDLARRGVTMGHRKRLPEAIVELRGCFRHAAGGSDDRGDRSVAGRPPGRRSQGRDHPRRCTRVALRMILPYGPARMAGVEIFELDDLEVAQARFQEPGRSAR